MPKSQHLFHSIGVLGNILLFPAPFFQEFISSWRLVTRVSLWSAYSIPSSFVKGIVGWLLAILTCTFDLVFPISVRFAQLDSHHSASSRGDLHLNSR